MKLEIISKKTINEQIAEQKQDMVDTVEPAKTKPVEVEVGKEAVFNNAVEQHEKAEKEIQKAMKPATDAAKETVAITASEESKTATAKKLVKDRKELVKLIDEAKANNKVYKISRSLVEGFRYELNVKDDLKEGAEGKKAPEGYKWVIYCDDEKDPKYDTIVAVRSTYTEAHFYWMQHLDKDLGVELVKTEDAVVGKSMQDIVEESKQNNAGDKQVLKEEDLPPVETPTPVVEEPKAVTPDSHETSKLTPEEKKSAVESMLNNLLADKFKSIDDVKSIITTIAFEGGYDDIAAILNEVADSSTIEIGMIQKALGIVSPSTDDSIKTGADKAEKIAEPDNTQKAEAESPKDESLTPVKHE